MDECDFVLVLSRIRPDCKDSEKTRVPQIEIHGARGVGSGNCLMSILFGKYAQMSAGIDSVARRCASGEVGYGVNIILGRHVE